MWFPHSCVVEAQLVAEGMARMLADDIGKNDTSIDHVSILLDTAAVPAHLHNKGIFQCDLKPKNVLLNAAGTRARLSDFCSSRRRPVRTVTTAVTRKAATPFYMALEVLSAQTCNTTASMDDRAHVVLVCDVMSAVVLKTFVTS